ncbi:MAG: preprotein translocase subunit SecG [Legionellales bacterium]|jgi:preprotein translocase subunit SecG|nr:preprotein translocase subunit SecG [Legionellales bacterium]MBK68749.1 preprotein translocase subunit SecG [Legionellales bacterium]|tara:strand:+ start:366 stop:737 length:372 start_codon:yes stop_codon:yes gene_type:complete
MESIYTLLFILQVIVAIALIAFVLIQHGKGADAGAAFGSGSSSTVFGSQGSGSFLTKVTTFLAIVFLANSLLLAYLASQSLRDVPESLLDTTPVVEQNETSTELQIPDEEYGDDQDIPKLPVE